MSPARACSRRLPPERLALGRDDVQVWRAALDLAPAQVRALWETLSTDEQARADRYRFARDRDRYIAARGLLRATLACYLDRAPAAVRFRYNPYGKPALDEESGDSTLRFNLAHTQGLALYAFARDREVGIDVESPRPGLHGEEIAEHFFSPHEVRALRALPPADQEQAFYRCWTRKEAYVKARGLGLSLALDGFDVSLAPEEPAALLRTSPDPADARRWSLWDLSSQGLVPWGLDQGSGYAAAVAVEGHGWRLQMWDVSNGEALVCGE